MAGVNRPRARGQAAIEPDPRSNVEDRGHGAQGQEGPRAPRERRRGAPGERDRRGRRPERDRSRRLGQGLAAAAARVEREGDEADRRGDGQRQPEGRGCEGEGRGGQGQGGRGVRGEDALGQRRARVPDALASIDEPEPQRVAGEERGERGESEAEPGGRGREHEPQDHGLGEKAPPAVLRGEGHRPPRNRRRTLRRLGPRGSHRAASLAPARAEEQDRDRQDQRDDADHQEDRVGRGARPLERVEGPAHQEGEPPRVPVAVLRGRPRAAGRRPGRGRPPS